MRCPAAGDLAILELGGQCRTMPAPQSAAVMPAQLNAAQRLRSVWFVSVAGLGLGGYARRSESATDNPGYS